MFLLFLTCQSILAELNRSAIDQDKRKNNIYINNSQLIFKNKSLLMSNYIDAYVFPIPSAKLELYKTIADEVANIWKEHGAIDYFEYVGNDLQIEGTRSFPECLGSKNDEAIIFGWIVFSSPEARKVAHEKVAADPRMNELVAPITDPANIIFDAKRMVYGGFAPLVG